MNPVTGRLEHHPSGWIGGGEKIGRVVSTDFVHQHQCRILLEDVRTIKFAEYLAEPPPGGFAGAAHAQIEGHILTLGMVAGPQRDGGLFVVHACKIYVATFGSDTFEEVTEVHARERPFGGVDFRPPWLCRFRHA